jgi:hypothetical protein
MKCCTTVNKMSSTKCYLSPACTANVVVPMIFPSLLKDVDC